MGFLSLPVWMTSLGGGSIFGGILITILYKGVHKTSADWFRRYRSGRGHGSDYDNGPDL